MNKWIKGLAVAWWIAAPVLVTGVIAQIVSGLPFTLTNGTVADATQVMANFNQIVNNTNANAAKNGVNNDITALTALVTPLNPSQGGTSVFIASATGGGSANAQTVATTIPSTFALTTNYAVQFVPGFTNTGATTLNVASTGIKNVFKQSFSGSVALTGGEIRSGQAATVAYDGTQYVLLDTPPPLGVSTDLASAGTTDLGTIASHVVRVTGTNGITAFGSSASVDFPIYLLRFSGALTITHNATSLIVPGAVNVTTAAGDSAIAQYLGSGNWQIVSFVRAAAVPPLSIVALNPTAQRLTSGTGATYTATAGTVRQRVRMVGGGGGGGAVATNNGANGTASSLQVNGAGTAWTAAAGVGGATASGAGGSGGGGGTDGVGTLITRILGSDGNGGSASGTGGVGIASGAGGAGGCFSGAGGSRQGGAAGAGNNGRTNSGGGGSGGYTTSGASGGGGGGGECVEFWVTGMNTATYTVGPGGNGGAAGTQAGGNGATGYIVIEEYAQ